ncbi:PAS domain S-box protein [Thalassoglobus sp. JC818]|uniref:PAS domain S-box protein n=1 Tax=Thalassoglobus sp. JC818 TaxID=3232136 RepID=UPI00345B104A
MSVPGTQLLSVFTSNDEIRLLLEASQIIVWTHWPAGHRLFHSKEWSQFTGQAHQLNQSADWHESVHPEDISLLLRNYDSANGEKSEQTFQVRYRRYCGRYFSYLERALPVVDANGKVDHWFGVSLSQEEHPPFPVLADRNFLLQAIFDNVPECVKVFDRDGKFQVINRAGLAMIEADSFEEVLGNTAWWCIAPEHHTAVRRMNANVLRGECASTEYDVIGKKGGRRNVKTHGIPMFDPSGDVTGILSITRDLTVERNAEIAIRASSMRLRRLVEELPASAICIEGNSVFFNRAAQDLFGYSPDEVSTVDEWFSLLYRERCDEMLELYEADRTQAFPLKREVQVNCRSGEIKTVEFAGYEDHEVEIWVVHDVTERKRAEEAVRIRERQLSTLMSNLPGAAYRCLNDKDWTMEFISDGCVQVSGYPAEKLTQGVPTWSELMHPDDRQPIWETVQDSLSQRQSFQVVYRIQHRDGDERVIWEQGRGVVNAHGQIEAIEGFLTDMTEMEQMKQQLVQSERLAAMGKMLSALAHESRNALQRIQSGVEMLKFEFEQDSESYEDLRRIAGAREDLQRLYDEMRSFAAPMNLQISDCDLSGIWTKAWNHLESTWNSRNVQLKQNLSDINLRVSVDAFRLEQVFRNLFENALAACDDPVVIEISCDNSDIHGKPGVCVTLRDNGPGLKEEHRARIFEAFFTTKHKGSGLGMAIAKRIVEAHRGKIEVRNSTSGGAEFLLVIPRDQP